ncbi:MAG: HAMP domain-containing sensor histidine kinase [Flavobacterium sp.]|nr:HAMP domain-containing sensor histidine kinase [Flavobacterium sp.]
MVVIRNIAVGIRCVAIFACILSTFLLYSNGLVYTSFFLVLVTVLLIFELISMIKNAFQFYDKTIQAILNDDFSADFSKNSTGNHYKSLLLLYERFKVRQHEQLSKDMVYQNILNNIETGILILQKSGNDWDIFQMNDYFSSHFQVPKVSKWAYLRKHLPTLCNAIEARDFGEIKTSVQITVDRQEMQTFILQASKTKTFDTEYYIILLDSIQKVIEKKEKEAWLNLMKVISHELMNSITPIRSLTQNLNELVQQESLSKEDLEDIRQSVSTIIHRSNHLQDFVESYRKLAMLPSPVKERIAVKDLFDSALLLMKSILTKENIIVKSNLDCNQNIFADKFQMEQVLINLLTNSIYALDGKSEKQIEIAIEVKSNRIFISIIDTGNGIEKEIEDKIFLPFFTTRKDGAGIGLTLSKNIIEAHGGYLQYQSEHAGTKFVICLIE